MASGTFTKLTKTTERTNDMANVKTEQEIESEIEEINDIIKQIETERIKSKDWIERLELRKVRLINLLPEDEFEALED